MPWALLALCLFSATPALAADWLAEEAPVRFTLRLAGRPTHGSAGYFAHLPDGGILPGPLPVTRVFTSSGTELESYLLWHNQDAGLAMVFADPGPRTDKVHVYVAGTRHPTLWRPETGLTPSAILCADPASGSMIAARNLSRLGRVGPTVHYRNKAGIRRAPFSVGGDDSGRPRPCAFYLLAHVVVSAPGETWIAPFVLDGECEVRVDGRLLKPEKRIDKWGGTGQGFDLEKGLHRIEVLQTAGGEGGFSDRREGGLMYLTWRTPNATAGELGGVRSENVPMSGTSRRETRVLGDREIARSGPCALERVESRDGGPAACVQMKASHIYWAGDEEPLIAYRLEAITGGNPDDTVYTWSLPGPGTVEGTSFTWLFPGLREHRFTLTAESQGRRSQCVHPFFGFTTARTDLNRADDRRAFRAACLSMVEAYPPRPDPAAGWGDAYWNNLFRTLDFGKGYPLLRNLFAARSATLRQRLSRDQIAELQGVFLDTAPRIDPEEALRWIRTFGEAERLAERRGLLKIREAEVYMYYLDDPGAAERVLGTLARGTGEIAERARIRLGDLALIGRDLNQATSFYADVQNRVRRNRNTGDAGPSASWKLGALLDVSAAENVDNLLAQGYLLEARGALDEWERTSPLTKVTGDYILHESRLFMEVEDWQRARPMLEAYCDLVDASSFLPDAAKALVECMVAMDVPDEEMRAYGKKLLDRLEFHPVARELEWMLEEE